MTLLDWTIVGLFNGAIIVYGLIRSRETKTSADWFLAGRTLPWWTVGLSLYATAIDSSDLVADSGGTYDLGVSYFVFSWVGIVSGWLVAAHFIALRSSQVEIRKLAFEQRESRGGPLPWILGLVMVALGAFLSFVVFW